MWKNKKNLFLGENLVIVKMTLPAEEISGGTCVFH